MSLAHEAATNLIGNSECPRFALPFFRGTSLRPVPPGESKQKEVRYLDIHEDDQFDEAQFAAWVKQASEFPRRTNVRGLCEVRARRARSPHEAFRVRVHGIAVPPA